MKIPLTYLNSNLGKISRAALTAQFLLPVFIFFNCKRDEPKPTTLAIVTSGEITEITGATAKVSGQVISDGNLQVTDRGVAVSSKVDPTIADARVPAGSGTGTFSAGLIGLSPITTYHIRAYATNSKGTSYGLDKAFTTGVVLPSLTTTNISSVTTTGALSGGNVTADGGAPVTVRGVVYGINPNPDLTGSKTTEGSGTGTFSSTLSGLSFATKYYLRAYATNSLGTAYGSQIEFTTQSVALPTLTTIPFTFITVTGGVTGGNVTADGGAPVTARGVVYGTSPNPDLTGSKTTDGIGTGLFNSTLNGFSLATKYYLRAYATNISGTGYGNQIEFTTLVNSNLNPNLIYGNVSDIDGNNYATIVIGPQTWMAENLKVSRFNNGDAIPNVSDAAEWTALTTGAYSNFNNDQSYNLIYGKLYNWYSVADSRKICPLGWHVPDDGEWTILETILGGSSLAGGKMKSIGTQYWESPNGAADNSSGFTGLPGGDRGNTGAFGEVRLNAIWWCTSEYQSIYALARVLGYSTGSLGRGGNPKGGGLSVRCLKD